MSALTVIEVHVAPDRFERSRLALLPCAVCACGCGKPTRKQFAKGHSHRGVGGGIPKAPYNTTGGLCECGCGELAPVAKLSRKATGQMAGEPLRFVPGHTGRMRLGRTVGSSGYVLVSAPDSSRQYKGRRYAAEHLVIAERALGKPLPEGAEVHHFNQDRADNRPGNLVICEDHAYHMLLHQRQRAQAECGNPNLFKCHYCGEYDDPACMKSKADKINSYYHSKCKIRDALHRRLRRRLPCAGCSSIGPHPELREEDDGWLAYCAACAPEASC